MPQFKGIRAHKTVASVGVIFYILYIFFAGIPAGWTRIRAAVFPWWPWGMFTGTTRFHYEPTARGTTLAGEKIPIALDALFPKTSHWALEGNRVIWGVRVKMRPGSSFTGYFCSWALARYNTRANATEKVQLLEIFLATWPLPPDTRTPPKQEILQTQCSTEIP